MGWLYLDKSDRWNLIALKPKPSEVWEKYTFGWIRPTPRCLTEGQGKRILFMCLLGGAF